MRFQGESSKHGLTQKCNQHHPLLVRLCPILSERESGVEWMVGFVMSIKGQYNATVAFHDGGSCVTRFQSLGL